MLSCKKLLATLFITMPLFCLAQTSLTSLSQSIFYVEKDWDDYSSHNLTLYGKNIWPDYMDMTMCINLVKVYFKKGSQVQEIAKMTVAKDKTTVSIIGSDWLTKPGFIEVYIMIDDLPIDGSFSQTNSLYISVESAPEVAPIITSISPNKIFSGVKDSKNEFNITGKFFGLDRTTKAYMNGTALNYAYENLMDGTMNVYIPNTYFTTPGTYDVQVKTKYGSSNIVQLVIEKPMPFTKIVSKIFGKPTETKPENNANPPITVNASPNSGVVTTAPDSKAGELIADGIKVKMQGNIMNVTDRAALEKFITGLDHVLIVDNQFNLSDNNMNMLFLISGKGIMQPELEKVKSAIEEKLKLMNLLNAVVIIN